MRQKSFICPDCGVVFDGPVVGGETRRCKPCRLVRRRQQNRRYYHQDEEKARAYARKKHHQYGEIARARVRESARKRHLRNKLAALAKYGDRCVCCGETRYQFLTFDHSNKDGAEHRRQLHGDSRIGGGPFLIALARAGWPDVPGLRTLCANCHLAIDLWGGCPHSA